jgi:type 1 glutamine amidotransferase
LSQEPLKVGYLYPALEYDSENSLRWLAGQLDSLHSTRGFFFHGQDAEEGSSEGNPTVIDNLHELDSLDVLVVYIRRMWMTADQQTQLIAFMNSGAGLVGIRTASHAIQSWGEEAKGIDREIWGGAYTANHGGESNYTLTFTPEASAHPITQDVNPWLADYTMYYQNDPEWTFAADNTVLMYGNDGVISNEPITWVRDLNGANVFYTSTGVQADFQQPEFQKMIINAVLWAGNRLGTGCMDVTAINYDEMALTPCTGCCQYAPCCSDTNYIEYTESCQNPQDSACLTPKSSAIEMTIPSESFLIVSPQVIQVDTEGGHSLKVSDVKGRIVFSESSQGTRQYILPSLEPGIYFVKLTAGSRQFSRILFIL